MPELTEEEKQSQSSDNSPPSSEAFEKNNCLGSNDSADSVGTGRDDEEGISDSCQNSSMSSCSGEYTSANKPRYSMETEHDQDINTEFGDDKLE